MRQIVWLGGQPIAALDGNAINDIQAEHLGTPRAVVDRSRNKVIWRWNITGEVFGADAPQEDPDKDGQSYAIDMLGHMIQVKMKIARHTNENAQ